MIEAKSSNPNFKTELSNGKFKVIADTTTEDGGQIAGFTPHEFLEIAIAACMSVWTRIYAHNHNIPLKEVNVKVKLLRDNPQETKFKYSLEFDKEISEENKEKLLKVAETCPVKKTLLKQLVFERE